MGGCDELKALFERPKRTVNINFKRIQLKGQTREIWVFIASIGEQDRLRLAYECLLYTHECTVSPESSLFAYTKYGSRRRFRPLALLDTSAYAFKGRL